ncbi:MAG TPA: M23 family metallopeptidase, partial [Gemmatimonadaceae bacterium]|nr:M23 family metallopeptidase [Gemmatimonadaceae bacterium]
AVVAAAATWTGETSSIAASTADRLAASQRTVVTLLDSVQSLGALAVRASRLPPRDMIMPVSGEITSPFSMSRLHPILGIFREHRGVDIAAPKGTPIVATAAGRVRSVGWRLDYGLTVEIEHTGDIATRYAHCTKAFVHVGDQVRGGDTIATVGSTGLATGPHVHFEVIDHGTPVDPIQFLARSHADLAPAAARPQGANGAAFR